MTLKEINLMEWMKVIPPEPTKHRYSYACFECRKAFREHMPFERVACCPQCGGKVWGMGMQFQPPRKQNKSAWQRIYRRRTHTREYISHGTPLLYRIERDAGLRKT